MKRWEDGVAEEEETPSTCDTQHKLSTCETTAIRHVDLLWTTFETVNEQKHFSSARRTLAGWRHIHVLGGEERVCKAQTKEGFARERCVCVGGGVG